ncbi:Eukaryotic translation initiation factor 2D [Trichoplax sp. H2]|nr:Eukaryotic translation initiation factor 2D [Trichoplax sp. H2]|eukprot:RDD37372.1 Eukaryotic translation initiation factor 2D [Trichoplax sp. H2]
MFRKPFRVKSSTITRKSIRRKLRADIIKQFASLTEDEVNQLIPSKEELTATIAITHSKEEVVIYSIAGEPLLFTYNNTLYPTVYAAWMLPHLLLAMITWPNVFDKMISGADLMLPGVTAVSHVEWVKHQACTIALSDCLVPVAVGLTAVSHQQAKDARMRGKGVYVLHTYRDYLWEFGTKCKAPTQCMISTYSLRGSTDTLQLENLAIANDLDLCEEQESIDQSGMNEMEGSAALNITTTATDESKQIDDPCKVDSNNDSTGREGATEESTQEAEGTATENSEVAINPTDTMDQLYQKCFMKAVISCLRNKTELPLLASSFNRIMQSYCEEGENLNIKKSSYKKFLTFLKVMKERGIIDFKDTARGVQSITTIQRGHPEVKAFAANYPVEEVTEIPSESNDDALVWEKGPIIEELYMANKQTAFIFSNLDWKNKLFNVADVRAAITSYIKAHDLINPHQTRLVNLNDALGNCLLTKNDKGNALSWEEIMKRFTAKMSNCHQIILPNDDRPILRKGKVDLINVSIVRRSGNKKVTLIDNLESFGIPVDKFMHTLQNMAAASTCTYSVPGKKSTGTQVMVQGSQIKIVSRILIENLKIPKKFITGIGK